MNKIIHNYSHLANKTSLWDTSDSEDLYKQNLKDNNSRKKLYELGYIDTSIKYTFNSHGFRTHEFDKDFDVICFGCSYTLGTGVKNDDTWPVQLEKITNLTIANLGHAGSSNDTTFRFALHYLPILKPKTVVWLQTDMHRFELIDEIQNVSLNIHANDASHCLNKDYYYKLWTSSSINQILNLEKNTLAMQQLCEMYNINLIILKAHSFEVIDLGRDLMHPGKKSYELLVQNIVSNNSFFN